MKKRIVSVLLTLCLLLALLPASVSAAGSVYSDTLDNISYTFDSNGLLTISGSGSIPSGAFQNLNAQFVVIKEGITGIESSAFADNFWIESITLPSSLVSIDAFAFYGCENLTSIVIPNSVREIREGAFMDCVSLTSVTLSDTLQKIDDVTFSGCYSLTSITIPSSVRKIGMGAFMDCSSLTSVILPDNLADFTPDAFINCCALTELSISDKNPLFSTSNGILYNKDGSLLVIYPAGKPENAFTIPEDVTALALCAFDSCHNLETITLPDQLSDFSPFVISNCIHLTNILVSSQNSFYSTRDGILYDKQGTTLAAYPQGRPDAAFTVPDGIEIIGSGAFYESTNLTSVTLPDGIEIIGWGAFSECTNLTSVMLPDTLQEISYGAFDYCENLESIVIPDSVYEIGSSAFSGCYSLTEITLPSRLTTINLWLFFNCYNLSSITIPDSVRTIESSAFAWCNALEHITIPDSVTAIAEDTFEGCENVLLLCNPGSYAAQFAKENDILFRYPGQPRFDDVAATAWYAGYVDYVYRNGLMNGTGDYVFNPNGTVTRGQLVTILHRMEGEPLVWSYDTFSDVPWDKYYSDAVEWAAAYGIVNGFSDGTFKPNNPVTREQIATILYRYDGSPDVSGSLSSFPDAGTVSSYARDAMIWAVSQGLITGVKNGNITTLSPKSNATRAQIAAIIQRYQELPIPARNDRLIGIAMPTDALLRWEQDGSQLKQQLEDLGYEVDLQYGDNDPALQSAQIKSMIKNGCKVIVVAAIDSDALLPAMAQAKKAGVQVIAYDRLLMGTDALTGYVTFDMWDIGVKQGQYIADALDLEHAGDKTYNIEFATGDPGDSNIFFFYEGALSVLRPYMDAGILRTPSGQTDIMEVATEYWDGAYAQERFERILSAYYADGTPLHAILASNDSIAQGAAQALTEGYENAIYPVITGQDCDLHSVRNILSGRQAMSVFRDTRILAARTVEMADALMRDQAPLFNDYDTYHNGSILVPSYLCAPAVCTRDNYRELLIDSGYYSEDELL